VTNREDAVDRLVLRETLHALEGDPCLIAAGGADGHGRTGHGEQMVQGDLRRERRFRVAARQDRADLACAAEVRARDALLVRVQWLVDQLAERREPGEPGTNQRSAIDESGHVRQYDILPHGGN